MKKQLFLLAAILAMASSTPAWAYDFSAFAPSGQVLYYNIVSGSAQVTYENSTSPTYPTGALTIPSSVTCNGTTYTVTSIGEYAFDNCTGLTSVTIPNSVTSIGEYAFHNCSGLTSTIYTGTIAQWCGISFGGGFANPLMCSHSLTIGGSEVTNLVIPNGVTEIKQYAFDYCTGLTSVTIPNSVTSIGNYAFNCTGLTSTIYTGTIAQWCNISFGNYEANPLNRSHSLTIGGSEVTNLVIPNGVTEIKQYAFGGCRGLTSVTIPNNVTSIGDGAFESCSGLTSVTIPNSVTSIGNAAFYECTGLTSVTIPSSVTSIGYSTFYCCTGLTSVTIPNSVTSIGNHAFCGCSGLTSFTMGSGVTSIGVYALWGCDGLRNIISKAVYPPTASDNTFENVSRYCTLTVPCGSLQDYQSTSPWNTQFPLMEEDCNPDGIDDTEIGDVMVYAANGMIYISSTLPTETTIFDITGHQVATFTAEAASIPLPAGVYLVKIGAYPARKVVVIR